MPNATTASRTEATILNRLDYRIEHLENTGRLVDGVECDNYGDADLLSDAADTIAQLTEALQALYEYASADPDGIEDDLDLCCKIAIALGANPVPQMDPDLSFPIFQPPAHLPDSRHYTYRGELEPEPEAIPAPSPDTLWILTRGDDDDEFTDEAMYTNKKVAETELARYSSKYPLNTFLLIEHPRRSDADFAMIYASLPPTKDQS